MWKATLRGILARKLRLAMTALAVVLGVAFVTGTYVLTDTLQHSFAGIFADTKAGVDVVVQAPEPQAGPAAQRNRIPEVVLPLVRRVPGVATADGYVQGSAKFVDRHGHVIQNGLAPTLGGSWPESGRGPVRLVDDGRSRPPRRPNEVVMDATTARRHGFAVGDRVRVLSQGPAKTFRIVGLFGFGGRFDLGGVTFAGFDLRTAQDLFEVPGMVNAINVTAQPGVSATELRFRLAGALGPGFDVAAASEVARQTAEPVRQGIGLIRYALFGFAAVGLVVGSFIIFNTFTTLVAQRTRELGLLRAMGASGRQVLGAVIGEAVAVGVIAAAMGLGAGVVVARLLLVLVERFGFDVPDTTPVVLGRTVLAAVVVGVVVTTASVLYPALRAARTPPVAVINEVRSPGGPTLRRRAVVAVVTGALGIGVLVLGLRVDVTDVFRRVAVVGAGALLVFLGAVLSIAVFATAFARVVGWPLAQRHVTGGLARANAMRNPRRTAATASALVVGLSLVSLVAIFSSSIKASIRSGVRDGVRADFVLSAQQLAAFSSQVADRVAKLPAVGAVSGLRLGPVTADGRAQVVMAVDPRTFTRVLDLDIRSMRPGALANGGILLPEDEARRRHVRPGDSIPVTFRNGTASMTVAGVYRRIQFTGGYPVPYGVISLSTYEQFVSATPQDSLVYVKARSRRLAEAQREMKHALAQRFPDVEVQTRAEFQGKQESEVDQFIGVLVALLVLSEVIAVLGIVNTLLLSVYERTPELGLLRIVGMSRRQVRGMVRGESMIVAFIGGSVGLAIGIFWGWAFTSALRQEGITEFRVPPLQLVGFLVFSVVAGIVAALLPAWRATHLDVLETITQE